MERAGVHNVVYTKCISAVVPVYIFTATLYIYYTYLPIIQLSPSGSLLLLLSVCKARVRPAVLSITNRCLCAVCVLYSSHIFLLIPFTAFILNDFFLALPSISITFISHVPSSLFHLYHTSLRLSHFYITLPFHLHHIYITLLFHLHLIYITLPFVSIPFISHFP